MTEQNIMSHMSRQWGWVALRGVAAVIFGLLALLMPAITLSVLILVWGAYALTDGVFSLIAGFRIRENGKPLWSLIIVGLLGIGAGLATFIWPGLTALLLLFIIASWAVVSGVFQLMAAFRFRKEIQNEWIHGLSGLVSIVFGALMLWNPESGAVALVWVIGMYSVFFGLLVLWFAWRLKNCPSRGAA